MTNTTTTRPSPWLAHVRPNPQARLRLFCFPYSGGSASIFTTWADILPATVEVCPVQLPGRGTRVTQPPFRRIEPLVEALGEGLLPYMDLPFAFFGHSMGALVSFELARHLRRQHGLAPVHFCASAHRAPQVPDPGPLLHNLPDPELVDELRRLNGTPEDVLTHPELLQLVLPTLRADFTVCEIYSYAPDEPLACPILALGGLRDTNIPREDLAAWREQTRGPFALRMFPGDHFFMNTERMLLLQTLARDLAQHVGL